MMFTDPIYSTMVDKSLDTLVLEDGSHAASLGQASVEDDQDQSEDCHLPCIFTPLKRKLGEWDVLIGNRREQQQFGSHMGTIRYHKIVVQYRQAYGMATTRLDKMHVCQTIYNMILSNGGQFLEHQAHDVTCQHFDEMTEQKALSKISQSLCMGMRRRGNNNIINNKMPTKIMRNKCNPCLHQRRRHPRDNTSSMNNATSDMVAQHMQKLWASIQHQSQQPQRTVVEEPLECDLTEQPQKPLVRRVSTDHLNDTDNDSDEDALLLLPMPRLERQQHFSSPNSSDSRNVEKDSLGR